MTPVVLEPTVMPTADKNSGQPRGEVLIEERVLRYPQSARDSFNAGATRAEREAAIRTVLPAFQEIDERFFTQPEKWFGEAFVLKHLHDTEGWEGQVWWCFFESEWRAAPRHKAGYDLVVALIPPADLQRLREVVRKRTITHLGSGRPDLILHRSGEVKFVEVKMGSRDPFRACQRRAAAEILGILGLPFEIVRLREHEERFRPKPPYRLDVGHYL